MIRCRREFLKTAAATGLFGALPVQALSAATRFEPRYGIAKLFEGLPGDLGFKIHAPSSKGRIGFDAQWNAGKLLFAASAIKTFALGEALRQADSSDIDHALEAKELRLDASVWSPGAPIFNPPDLSGIVSERTALEAMILRSDNTATDMIFKLVGVDNIRKLIASAGLKQTWVPDSTRAFAGYMFGAKNYKTITWDELGDEIKKAKGEIQQPFLNDVETMASTAEDFVTWYSQALQGRFFRHRKTLQEFRRIQTLCDYIYLIPLPLGVSAYAKSGNLDAKLSDKVAGELGKKGTPFFHARTIAGGMYFAGRWVYFAFLLNWYTPEFDDQRTVDKFFAAINEALTRVRDFLS